MQRIGLTVAGMRVDVTVAHRSHDLWAASGEFADREIVVLDRSLDGAVKRWQLAACDNWVPAADEWMAAAAA